MRVVAGEFKGRKLKGFKGSEIRPLTDRIKTSIFDYLQSSIGESRVLDIFSGTGSFGIEALSRGAGEVTFVEKQRSSLEVLKKNLEMLSVDPKKYRIVHFDALEYIRLLKKSPGTYDIIFLDPPFKYSFFDDLLNEIAFNSPPRKNGLLVLRHPVNLNFEEAGYLKLVRDKKFGESIVKFFINYGENK